MSFIRYFAYGSNLLTPRLRARCPSARAVGAARAHGYGLGFDKRGADGSGKASLLRAEKNSAHGVLFDIAADDLPALDRAEGGYRRVADFEIELDGVRDTALTYLADTPAPGLRPFNWYLALVVAGAREHGLHTDYVERIRMHAHEVDDREQCRFRDAAHAALEEAGYHSAHAALQISS